MVIRYLEPTVAGGFIVVVLLNSSWAR